MWIGITANNITISGTPYEVPRSVVSGQPDPGSYYIVPCVIVNGGRQILALRDDLFSSDALNLEIGEKITPTILNPTHNFIRGFMSYTHTSDESINTKDYVIAIYDTLTL